mgnify:CR=1 FL=1
MPALPLPLFFSPDEMDQIDGALKTLERIFTRLYLLDEEELCGMGELDKTSEGMCRKLLQIFAHDPQILPASFDLLGFRRDMASLDQVRPIIARLQRLFDKAADTERILGDDLSFTVFDGYALVKLIGSPEDAQALLDILSGKVSA